MNTGGPASEKTLLDEFAGQALAAMVEAESKESHKQLTNDGYGSEETYFTSGFADEDYWDGAAKASYACASAMLAEKARREATGKDSLTVQTREVDDDRWAKFQDGIIITFEPTMGWCASIREGSLGSGNTIAEAVANLRTMWEEKSAAPVVQQTSTTESYITDKNGIPVARVTHAPISDHSPDATKMVEPATGLQVVAHERAQALDRVAELEAGNTMLKREIERLRTELCENVDSWAKLKIANRELVEALDNIIDGWVDRNDDAELATKARAILSKHKGAA